MTLPHQDTRQVAAHYDRCVERHGDSPRSADWGSLDSQNKRFEVLADIGILSGHTVLDVGCGLGSFYRFLAGKNIKVDYTGLDISWKMAQHANMAIERGSIIQGNLDCISGERKRFDWVVASGVFTYGFSDVAGVFNEAVEKMWRVAGSGVAFNVLSSWADTRTPGELQVDPSDILPLCSTLTRRVCLRHDYMPHDFTVYLFRPD